MKAHDVRTLRHCAQCGGLVHRHNYSDAALRCIRCCWVAAGGSVDEYTRRFPREDWGKLTLELVGPDNMRRLLAWLASQEEEETR